MGGRGGGTRRLAVDLGLTVDWVLLAKAVDNLPPCELRLPLHPRHGVCVWWWLWWWQCVGCGVWGVHGFTAVKHETGVVAALLGLPHGGQH